MPITFIPFLNTRPDATGRHRLYLKITLPVPKKTPVRKSIPLLYAIPKKAWNPKKREVRSNYHSSDTINQYLQHKINLGLSAVANAEINQTKINPDQLVQAIKQEKTNVIEKFIPWIKEQIDKHYPPDLKHSTWEKYHVTYNRLIAFEQDYETLYMSSLSEHMVQQFRFFVERLGKAHNTVSNDLKRLRTMVKWAEKAKFIKHEDNPFNDVKITWKDSEKHALTTDEIQRLSDIQLPAMQHTARQFWLAMYHCYGMRVSDMLFLKWKNIKDGRVRYKMQKTNTLMIIPITEEIARIFREQRENNTVKDFVWPYVENDFVYGTKAFRNEKSKATSRVNKSLGNIKRKLKLDKKFTNHIARHSYAYHTYLKTKDIYIVKNRLGHKSVTETQCYLKSLGVHGLEEVYD